MESHGLVVDDSAAIRKMLHRVLRQTGMAIGEIYEADDGQEALGLLKTKTVSLAIPRVAGLRRTRK
jgi:two-component system chemotaxis response regulator CheY